MNRKKTPVRAWAVCVWLLVWQLGSMALRAAYPHGALLLASPVSAAKRLAELAMTAAFWRAAGTSAAHILGGFLPKKKYLDNLSEGEHTLKVVFVDGEASTTFTVVKLNKENPKTGDNIVIYILTGIVSTLGLGGVYFYRRKQTN